MRADDDRQPSRPPARAAALARSAPFTEPVSSATGTGDSARQRAVVLLRQHLGRRHQRRLRAGLDRAQHGEQRHQRLAGADIALQQPQHPARRRQVGVDLGQRLSCEAVGAWPNAAQRLGAQRRRRRSARGRAARAPGRAPARAPPGRPAARRRRGGARATRSGGVSAGACTARRAVGEAGPALAAQQGGVVPLRQVAAGARSACATLARAPGTAHKPGGQRPDRLDRRHAGRALRRAPHDRDAAWSAGRRTLRACRRPAAARPAASAASRVKAEEDQLGEAGAVADDHPPGLARLGGALVPHDLDRQTSRPGPALRCRDASAGRAGRCSDRAGGTAGRAPARRRAALARSAAASAGRRRAGWSAARKAGRAGHRIAATG